MSCSSALLISSSNQQPNITNYFCEKHQLFLTTLPLKTKLGKATALDQHINRPAYVKEDFGKALNHFYKENPSVSKNPNNWKDSHETYENEILEYYGKHRRGTHMPLRYNQLKNNSHLK